MSLSPLSQACLDFVRLKGQARIGEVFAAVNHLVDAEVARRCGKKRTEDESRRWGKKGAEGERGLLSPAHLEYVGRRWVVGNCLVKLVRGGRIKRLDRGMYASTDEVPRSSEGTNHPPLMRLCVAAVGSLGRATTYEIGAAVDRHIDTAWAMGRGRETVEVQRRRCFSESYRARYPTRARSSKVYTHEEVERLGRNRIVSQAISNACKEGLLIRLARGRRKAIYALPPAPAASSGSPGVGEAGTVGGAVLAGPRGCPAQAARLSPDTAGAREPKGALLGGQRAPATIFTARPAQGRARLSSGALARAEARPLVAARAGRAELPTEGSET